jgi:hypothetical protein
VAAIHTDDEVTPTSDEASRLGAVSGSDGRTVGDLLGVALVHSAASWAIVDERVVARSGRSSLAVALDPVSSVVWRCLDGVSPLADVLADVADAFAVPVDRAIDELVPVVTSWLDEGLVDVAADHAADDAADDAADGERGRRWRRLVDPPNA